MGWASATPLVKNIINATMTHVKDYATRVELYRDIIEAFIVEDWDTMDEVMGIDLAFDIALKKVCPEYEDN